METTSSKELLRSVRRLLRVVIVVLFTFSLVFSILLDRLGDNIDRNTVNISTVGVDARETRHALEEALEQATENSDPTLVRRINEGLDAIKRIEAKLEEEGP